MSDFVCAISGSAAPALDHDDGDLGDLPEGWAEVSVSFRSVNPRYEDVQKAKGQMRAAQISAVPEDKRDDEIRKFIALSVDANFAALEGGTPRYIEEAHTVHVSAEQLAGLLTTLGIEQEEA